MLATSGLEKQPRVIQHVPVSSRRAPSPEPPGFHTPCLATAWGSTKTILPSVNPCLLRNNPSSGIGIDQHHTQVSFPSPMAVLWPVCIPRKAQRGEMVTGSHSPQGREYSALSGPTSRPFSWRHRGCVWN